MIRLLKRRTQKQPQEPQLVPLREIESRLIGLLKDDEAGIVRAVEFAVANAVHHRASDVHFEPWDRCLAVRYRIDGMLHNVAEIPTHAQERIISRLKVLAKLVTYQKDVPQDGRIDAVSFGQSGIEGVQALRVSTIPTVYGEKVVVRLLGVGQSLLGLDQLGFDAALTDRLRELVNRPQGTFLLTGPSSSGKTTTIYALLNCLMTECPSTSHIVTIEDPVEYRLGQVAQTQLAPHAGYTYEKALRAILRQDPEVIMVGEIRDAETAAAVIQAGLTGHLVISTIHSGTAAGVFTRLIDMGVEPFLIASSVSGVLAQRLVRINCTACSEDYTPDPEVIARVGRLGVALEQLQQHSPYRRGRGCDICQGIGYRGRTAVGELLAVDETLAELVLQRSRTRILHDTAVRSGMAPLLDSALKMAFAGTTTLEELPSVVPPPLQTAGEVGP